MKINVKTDQLHLLCKEKVNKKGLNSGISNSVCERFFTTNSDKHFRFKKI